jgi:translation initiation factor 4G
MDLTLNNRSQPVILDKDSNTPETDSMSSPVPPRIETDRSRELGSDMTKLELETSTPYRGSDPHLRPSELLVEEGGPRSKPEDRPRSQSEMKESTHSTSRKNDRSRAKSESRRETNSNFSPVDLVLRKVLALFNKLTRSNFQVITSQLLQLLQANQHLGLELLRGTVTIIFDKAVAEAFFAHIYSEMCQTISLDVNDLFIPHYAQEFKERNLAAAEKAQSEAQRLKAIADTEATAESRARAAEAEITTFKVGEMSRQALDDKKTKNVFKGILLTGCQKEFEKGVRVIPNESMTAQEISELQSAQKRRMLGNIRFIGELYKKGLVIELIIYTCIDHLIANPSEEEIEALCNLVRTVGANLDASARGKIFVDTKFKQIETLMTSTGAPVFSNTTLSGGAPRASPSPSEGGSKLSARLRFMLLDLQDLRKNKWKARS